MHAARAKSYYSTADYYSEGQELTGRWRGEAARRLGLSGEVNKADWDALCDNRHPVSGSQLTPRLRSDRTVGYDFNFHVPKSVSLLYAMTRDERLLDAFREAVDGTMHDIEAEMRTRVRKGGKNEDRVTGNLAWGEFIHLTSRPVDGVPDPHLHAHCFAFNTTFDTKEDGWKAGQFRELKRDAPYFEAVFHSCLAHRLAARRPRSGGHAGVAAQGRHDDRLRLRLAGAGRFRPVGRDYAEIHGSDGKNSRPKPQWRTPRERAAVRRPGAASRAVDSGGGRGAVAPGVEGRHLDRGDQGGLRIASTLPANRWCNVGNSMAGVKTHASRRFHLTDLSFSTQDCRISGGTQ